MELTRQQGVLPSGSQYLIEVPDKWNGILLLSCRPLPRDEGEPPWESGEPLLAHLLQQGYALAGSANTIFWPLERLFADQVPLLEEFDRAVTSPRHTIAWGPSIGGIMTAGLVQLMPERLSGALPLCGNLAGAVAIHNRELDIAFVVKTLLAPTSDLQLVRIRDPEANLRLAYSVLEEAAATPRGRARLALAAAIGNIPGWRDDGSAEEPAAEDVTSRLDNQLRWFDEPGFFVYFVARAQVERQAGGNFSWNTGVDYASLLARSINRGQVQTLYEEARLDLSTDLSRLASAERVDADPDAVSYLERHIVFSGDLGDVPVLAVHTDGDGLVTPDNMTAYADVVGWAGQADLLRQLFVHRGGHCTFTAAETLTALHALIERVESGSWPRLDPDTLNATAANLQRGLVALPNDRITDPAFFRFQPWSFPRPYDVRDRGQVVG
ncbi:MAG: hypothetical protein ACR2JO_12330 [Mycobacteriales bacterium]